MYKRVFEVAAKAVRGSRRRWLQTPAMELELELYKAGSHSHNTRKTPPRSMFVALVMSTTAAGLLLASLPGGPFSGSNSSSGKPTYADKARAPAQPPKPTPEPEPEPEPFDARDLPEISIDTNVLMTYRLDDMNDRLGSAMYQNPDVKKFLNNRKYRLVIPRCLAGEVLWDNSTRTVNREGHSETARQIGRIGYLESHPAATRAAQRVRESSRKRGGDYAPFVRQSDYKDLLAYFTACAHGVPHLTLDAEFVFNLVDSRSLFESACKDAEITPSPLHLAKWRTKHHLKHTSNVELVQNLGSFLHVHDLD